MDSNSVKLRAQVKLDDAISQMKAAQQEVARLEAFLATFDELSAEVEPTRADSTVTVSEVQRDISVRTRQVSINRFTSDAAEAVLREVNRPLPTAALLKEIVQRKLVVFDGKDPASLLFTRLDRAKRLVHQRGIGWMTPELHATTCSPVLASAVEIAEADLQNGQVVPLEKKPRFDPSEHDASKAFESSGHTG